MRLFRSCLLLAGSLALAVPVAASAPDTIKSRQDNFKSMGRSMKMISDEVRKSKPDFAVIRREAARLERASGRIPRLFPAGTGPEAGVTTEALPVIWTNAAGFRAASGKLTTATKGLRAAAASNDVGRVRAALGGTGGACKECHDTYRLKK